MTSNPLSAYLGQVRNDSRKESSSRRQQIAQWRKAVDKLYAEVGRLVEGQAKLSFRATEIHEQLLGTYKTRILTLQIEPYRLTLTPKGAKVIGAQGRVDMTGPRGAVRFIRIAGDDKDEWCVALDPARPGELAPLRAGSLAAAFRYAIDGPQTTTHSNAPRTASRARRD